MPAANPACPICNRTDQTGKVSAIYILALQAQHPKAVLEAGELPPRVQVPFLDELTRDELVALGKRLAPPSAPKRLPARPLHPDMVVVVFSLFLPVFLTGIRTSQPAMFYPVLTLLLAGYGLYFWKRRPAIARFEQQLAVRQESSERIRRALGRWMRLYYCAEDDVVFTLGSQEATPADQIAGFLLRK